MFVVQASSTRISVTSRETQKTEYKKKKSCYLQCFCLFILWKLEVNQHCSVILLFLICFISQGGRARYLRYDGKFCINNVANFVLKEFWKLSDICQNYKRM